MQGTDMGSSNVWGELQFRYKRPVRDIAMAKIGARESVHSGFSLIRMRWVRGKRFTASSIFALFDCARCSFLFGDAGLLIAICAFLLVLNERVRFSKRERNRLMHFQEAPVGFA